MALLSVLVPLFNEEEFVAHALQRVIDPPLPTKHSSGKTLEALEIGAGIGNLTQALAPKRKRYIAICSNVLENVKDDVAGMRNIHGALKSRGRAIIPAPHDQGIFWRHQLCSINR